MKDKNKQFKLKKLFAKKVSRKFFSLLTRVLSSLRVFEKTKFNEQRFFCFVSAAMSFPELCASDLQAHFSLGLIN